MGGRGRACDDRIRVVPVEQEARIRTPRSQKMAHNTRQMDPMGSCKSEPVLYRP